MALNIMAQTNVADFAHLGADHVQLLSEAFSLAMAERDRFVSDSAFNTLPVEKLLSDAFAAQQFGRINFAQALSQPVASALPNHKDTVYLTVVDKDRNACSFINSVFYSWEADWWRVIRALIYKIAGAVSHLKKGISISLNQVKGRCIQLSRQWYTRRENRCLALA